MSKTFVLLVTAIAIISLINALTIRDQDVTPAVAKVTPIVEPHFIRCSKEGLMPHPTDRHKYIDCKYIKSGENKGWLTIVLQCAPGTQYTQKTQSCIPEEVETATPEVTKVTPIVDPPIFRCTKQGYFEHPTDKHKYIQCEFVEDGKVKGWWIHIIECTPGTRWDQTSHSCVVDVEDAETVTTPRTFPGHRVIKCTKEGFMAHPSNKHKFVLCSHFATGDEKAWHINIYDCPESKQWDQTKEECVQDTN